jgi:hypothetical protein
VSRSSTPGREASPRGGESDRLGSAIVTDSATIPVGPGEKKSKSALKRRPKPPEQQEARRFLMPHDPELPMHQAQDPRAETQTRRAAHLDPATADLVDRLRDLQLPRAARIARARRLLFTGALDQPAVYRETARRILGLDPEA